MPWAYVGAVRQNNEIYVTIAKTEDPTKSETRCWIYPEHPVVDRRRKGGPMPRPGQLWDDFVASVRFETEALITAYNQAEQVAAEPVVDVSDALKP